MKVLVAGATGVIGRQLVPLLQQRGDHVVAMSRSVTDLRVEAIEAFPADALDEDAVREVVRRTRPDAVVNLLSAIPHALAPRRFARQMAGTNDLRTRGTANLVRSTEGAVPMVSASVAFLYRPGGAPVVDEERALWTDGPASTRAVVQAIIAGEEQTLAAHGTVLRMGHLYGPGTHLAVDGSLTQQVRRGRVPFVAARQSIFSFVHVQDAARAVLAALDRPDAGTLNVVDDEPAPIGEWLPELARLIEARTPGTAPGAMARLLGGSWGHAWMTALVGARNERARERLGWRPRRTSWRQGFAEELGARTSASDLDVQ